MRTLLGRRRVASPDPKDASGAEGRSPEGESFEAPRTADEGSPSLVENALFYGALLFVFVLAAYSLRDIFESVRFLKAAKAVPPAPPPPPPLGDARPNPALA
eukprot:jgi/Tetstr1/434133/TSEL_023277.t1